VFAFTTSLVYVGLRAVRGSIGALEGIVIAVRSLVATCRRRGSAARSPPTAQPIESSAEPGAGEKPLVKPPDLGGLIEAGPPAEPQDALIEAAPAAEPHADARAPTAARRGGS
jgi:hypothetical protein